VGKQAPPTRAAPSLVRALRDARGALPFAYMSVSPVKRRRSAPYQFLWSIKMTVPSARPELAASSARSGGQGWRSQRRRRLGLDRASTLLRYSRLVHPCFPGHGPRYMPCGSTASTYIRSAIDWAAPSSSAREARDPGRTGPIYLAAFMPCEQSVTRLSRRSGVCLGPRIQALRMAPVGITPVSRYRQSATTSFRATATIVIFRIRPCNVPTRWRYHCDSALSG
jgi:hypothetical protein